MNKTSAAIVRSLLLGTSCLSVVAAGAVHGQPTGGTVALGVGSIAEHGNTTVIDQKTGKLVINWDSFSIGAGGTVQFVQPDANAIALNRVLGSQPTSIYGSLLANGQVWLINGNGVLFGQGSRINVGGIIATTADIKDADFAAGNYSFSGGTGASVVNQGTITTKRGGYAVLSGASAQNQGLIAADSGTVVIGGASAFTVDFAGDGLIKYAITAPAQSADNGQTGAFNAGTIRAAGGRVIMTARAASSVQDAVVNNTGMISATSARVQNGEVILDAGDGDVAVSGTIDATGQAAGTTGGNVTITGRDIAVADGTKIDASGDAGGGTIRIGGDLHGDGALAQAQNVHVGTATLAADATRQGDGGTLVVWSAGTTDFSGIVSLKGGAAGGNGGLVETSGHTLNIAPTSKVDTRAPKGTTGIWLLDPDHIIVANDGTTTLNGGTLSAGQDPGETDTIAPSTIVAALATSSVTLESNDIIDVDDPVIYSSGNALNLLAKGDISLNASVQNTQSRSGGAINIVAGWDGTTEDPAHFTDPGVFGNNSGTVYLGSLAGDGKPGQDVAVGGASGTTTVATAALGMEADEGYAQLGFHGAGGGDIVLDAIGGDKSGLVGGPTSGDYAMIGNGSLGGDVAANVTGNITIRTDNTLLLLSNAGDSGAQGLPWIGNVAGGGFTESGNVSVTVANVYNGTYSGTFDGTYSPAALGAPGTLGSTLLADLGTTSQAGSGGDVTFGVTDPGTDFINASLGIGVLSYDSPHALTLLSTSSITLPYSIQNAGTGDLTVLAGWDPTVAPADVLTTPGAYGNPTSGRNDNGGVNGASIWVAGASNLSLTDYTAGGIYTVGPSGAGTAIGSKGGTTTIGAAQIYVEGLSGYAQIGYHDDGGSGAINVIANGVPGTGGLTGIGACFDANANICVIGGRQGFGAAASYAQIGDLGLGVAGTASSAINVSATGNISISGGGNYSSDSDGNPTPDAQVPNAYGQIGNGDASRSVAQTVSGTIVVQSAGQTSFVSSSAASSPGWLGNRTGDGGSQSGDVTLLASSANGAPATTSEMLAEDLGTGPGSGGNLTLGFSSTDPNYIGLLTYNSPHTFTDLAAGDLNVVGSIQNAGSGAINLVAGWDGHTLDPAAFTQHGVFGNNDATLTIGGANAKSGAVALGSAGGTTTVASANIEVLGTNARAQIGYHGNGGGDIVIRATDDLTLDSSNGFGAVIGNGHNGATAAVTGNIDIGIGGTFTQYGSDSVDPHLGNIAGSAGETGNLTLVAANASGDVDSSSVIASDLGGGNVTLAFTDPTFSAAPSVTYNSPYAYTLLEAGDITVGGPIVNNGAGAITLVAGWDGQTFDLATLKTGQNTFGNNGGSVTIGGVYAGGSVAVGSMGGAMTVLGDDVNVAAVQGNTQLGYHGAGTGDITVIAKGDIDVFGGDPYADGFSAMIGNGKLNAPGFGGSVGGNISIFAGGTLTLETATVFCGDCTDPTTIYIGNVSGTGQASGNLTMIAREFDDGNDSNGGIGEVLSNNIVHGDVTIGQTDPSNPATLKDGGNYTSNYALTLLSASDINIGGDIQNAGSGAITLVAGWDGVYDPTKIGAAGTFGLNNATVSIGGGEIQQDAGIGTLGGTLSVYTGNLAISANGGFAQLGYHGGGGTGGITVMATGNVTLTASASSDCGGCAAQIGNGGVRASGDNGGDISVTAQGNVTLNAGAEEYSFAQIGNGGDSASGSNSGTVFVSAGDALNINGGNDYAQIGNGGWGAQGNDSGSVTVSATNAIILTGQSDGSYGSIQIGNGGQSAVGTFSGDVAVTAGANLILTSGGEADFVQIGNGAADGSASGNASGAVTINVAGGTTFANSQGGATWLGNVAGGDGGKESGNLTFVTGSASDGDTGVISNIIVSNLGTSGDTGGDVLFAVTGRDLDVDNGGGSYSSPHTLSLLSTRNVEIATSLQNDGTGDINIVAGWNGTTFDPAHFTDAHVFGNGTAVVTVGGSLAGGDAAIGSAGGNTNVAANGVAVSAINGYAELGYRGAATGAVHLLSTGLTSLSGGEGISRYAQIGSGATLGSSAQAGDATLTVGSLSANGFAGVVANNLVLTSSTGNIGSSNSPLQIAVNSLAVTTQGRSVFLSSPQAVAIGGSGIVLGAGNFTLAAGGAITQTASIGAHALNVSTTSGAIALTNSGNAFGALTVATQGSDNASVSQASSITVTSAHVGGTLTLSGTAIVQTGAIQAAGLNVTATAGPVTLTNAGNSFAALSLSTTGSNAATVADSSGVTLGASTVGGKLTLSAGGAIGQSGALQSAGLSATTTSGAIAMTNTSNAVAGLAQFSTPGAASFYNTLTTTLGASTIGGDLTLLSAHDVDVVAPVQSTTGAITVVAGWDGSTIDSAHFGDAGVYGNNSGAVAIGGGSGPAGLGSQSGTTSVYAATLNILGTNASAQLGYHGTGGGAITVRVLNAMNLTAGAGNALLGNGSLGSDVTGNVTGDIDVRAGGNIFLTDSANGETWIGNVAHSGTETGNLILIASDIDSGQNDRVGSIVTATLGGGDVTLGFTGTGDQGPEQDYAVASSHTFNLLTAGNLVVAGSIQNSGAGAINLVAGWDGHTISPASFGNSGVFGNNGKGIVVGGADAQGNVAIGSAGGEISAYGASLALTAANGYAQLGFHGAGSGGILVDVTGGVTLTGGGATGAFAQLGNGGLKVSGNNAGDIAITAGGDVVLTGGAGTESYAQIGHGGAESNTGANGYSNQGAIVLSAANVTLDGGAANAAYAMIGQGGYKSGIGLTGGTALNSGGITVTAAHQVTLLGNGVDAFAQIGNGGSQSNLGAAASAGGTDSGLVTVTAPNGPAGAMSLTAGAGPNAYAQIGNGGYAINSGPSATAANYTVTGDVHVADLSLTGGGNNGYSLIGNGDATHTGFGNISGNLTIDANGNIVYTPGTGTNSQATIGNFTGEGSTSGALTGANPPPDGSVTGDPGTIGVVVTTTAGNGQQNGTPPITTINTVVVTPASGDTAPTTLTAHLEPTTPPGPLASLDTKGADSSQPNASDSATVVIADSLDGGKKPSTSQTILAGMLKQVSPTNASNTVHAIPPADQDFSSWGNEALWQ